MSGKRNHHIVGIDTNIFIYYFQKHYQFGSSAKKILQTVSKEKSKVITSTITLIELLSFKAPEEVLERLQAEFLSFPNLQTVDINQKIAVIAARIRREYNYKTADAIQLATALLLKVDVFITHDKRLQKFKEVQIQTLRE